MKRVVMLAVFAAAAFLGGCASTTGTTSTCTQNSVCPIVIYETWSGRFATYPDLVSVTSGNGLQTLVWTFADSTKYEFRATTSYITGDGVELVGANGNVAGLTSCFITRRSKEDYTPASSGPYYRCDVFSANGDPLKEPVAYKIRFHTKSGTQMMVDPSVVVRPSGTGDPPPTYTEVRAAAGDPVSLPSKDPSAVGVRVVWDSVVGRFNRASSPMVLYRGNPAGTEQVNIQPCTPSTEADGSKPAAEGRYYVCIFTSADPLVLTYVARFRDVNNTILTKSSTVIR